MQHQQVDTFAFTFSDLKVQQPTMEQRVAKMLRSIRIEDWKQSNWPKLVEWYGDFDLKSLVND